MSLIIIDYEDLNSNKDLSSLILSAYGKDSIGVIGIKNIPNFQQMKMKTLPLMYDLINLPNDKLNQLEDANSMYNSGWSLGKEKMGDKPDFSKGSFYFNPLQDNPLPEFREQFPWALPMNKWPEENDIKDFKTNCKEIGTEMRNIAVKLSYHIDKLISENNPNYEKNLFYNAMKDSIKAKARLLYYYPIQPNNNKCENENENNNCKTKDRGDNWIAWHNDSGFLTCLAGEIYVNHKTKEMIKNPEMDTAGLYVTDRQGNEIKVNIPDDIMGIQIGECLQIISGGLLVATPHCVRGCKNTPDVARISLPCFVDTFVTFPLSMPKNCTRDDVFLNTVNQKVPPLSERWLTNGVTFAEFLGDSFKSYYEWNTKK